MKRANILLQTGERELVDGEKRQLLYTEFHVVEFIFKPAHPVKLSSGVFCMRTWNGSVTLFPDSRTNLTPLYVGRSDLLFGLLIKLAALPLSQMTLKQASSHWLHRHSSLLVPSQSVPNSTSCTAWSVDLVSSAHFSDAWFHPLRTFAHWVYFTNWFPEISFSRQS